MNDNFDFMKSYFRRILFLMVLGGIFTFSSGSCGGMDFFYDIQRFTKEELIDDLENKEKSTQIGKDLQAFLQQVDSNDVNQKWQMIQEWLENRAKIPAEKEMALGFRAWMLATLGEWSAAYPYAEELCVKLNTKDAKYWSLLAYIENLRRNDEKLEEYFKQYFFLSDPHIAKSYADGIRYVEKGMNVEAEKAFSECIELANSIVPNHPFFYRERGMVCFRKGENLRLAYDDLYRVIRNLGAKNPQVVRMVWKILSFVDDAPQKIDIMDFIISQGRQGVYYAYRAYLKAQEKNLRGAQEDLEIAAKQVPDSLERKYITIDTYIQMDWIKKASDLYRSLTKQEQEMPEFAHIRGRLGFKECDDDKAVRGFQDYIAYAQDSPLESFVSIASAKKELALILGCLGKPREALEIIQSRNCVIESYYDMLLFMIYRELDMEDKLAELIPKGKVRIDVLEELNELTISYPFYCLWMAEHHRSSEIIDFIQTGYESLKTSDKLMPYQQMIEEILAYHFRTKELECEKIIQNAQSTPEQITKAQKRLKELEDRRQQPYVRLNVGNLFRLYANWR